MRCEDARAALSALADGDDSDDTIDAGAVSVHVAVCADCAAFAAGITSLRTALFEDEPPDVSAAVVERLATPRRSRRWLPQVAAVLIAGIVAGSVYVWPTNDGSDIAVASLPARIVAAQGDLRALSARLTVVEHGPDRTRQGTLEYRAPETLRLQLGDTTLDISPGTYRVDRPGATPIVRTGLEPFPEGLLAPLDLVLPAGGFADAAPPIFLGSRQLDGRSALGVRVTAAQVASVLDALRPGDDGREVHPADAVDLWLDHDSLVPLEVVVRATTGPDRDRWAAARGYDDRAGAVLLEARFTHVVINGAPTRAARSAPETKPVDPPVPAWVPDGMKRYRTGTFADVAVETWTDGRAWLKVRTTRSWPGGRLFGNLGAVVRELRFDSGVAYEAEGGDRVAIHADGIDVVVTGSVEPEDLRRVAAALPVHGVAVPADWAEAATASLRAVEAAVPRLLVLPSDAGWPAPAVRADDRTVVLVYAGPGERGLRLTSREGANLTPPLDRDAVGVVVRNRVARWSPDRSELEWVEGGRLWSLRSATVGFDELVHLADRLRAAR